MFTMRFDMRAPIGGAATTDLYAAAIEMAAWGETRGCVAATISEHHTAEDGYLPSPLLLASAIAARTDHLFIAIAAALLPFYDPIRLAEEMNQRTRSSFFKTLPRISTSSEAMRWIDLTGES